MDMRPISANCNFLSLWQGYGRYLSEQRAAGFYGKARERDRDWWELGPASAEEY